MESESMTAYDKLQDIITILDETEAIIDVSIDCSTSELNQAKERLTPLLMAADSLLKQASEIADGLEMQMNSEAHEELAILNTTA